MVKRSELLKRVVDFIKSCYAVLPPSIAISHKNRKKRMKAKKRKRTKNPTSKQVLQAAPEFSPSKKQKNKKERSRENSFPVVHIFFCLDFFFLLLLPRTQ
jgi:hypothetical protein